MEGHSRGEARIISAVRFIANKFNYELTKKSAIVSNPQ